MYIDHPIVIALRDFLLMSTTATFLCIFNVFLMFLLL